jgi:hypothetical protein
LSQSDPHSARAEIALIPHDEMTGAAPDPVVEKSANELVGRVLLEQADGETRAARKAVLEREPELL